MSQESVRNDVDKAIDDWSGIEAGGFGPGISLSSLWVRNHPTISYNPVGIDRLTGHIKRRPTFINCPRAGELDRDMFRDDGIRTVGHLYDYLSPCG